MHRRDSDREASPKRHRGDEDGNRRGNHGSGNNGRGNGRGGNGRGSFEDRGDSSGDRGGPSGDRGGLSGDQGGSSGGRGGGGVRAGRGRPRKTFEERRQERLDQHDLVISRPVVNGQQQKKMGSSGRPTKLLANYFKLEKRTDWAIFHYRVDFVPDETDTRIKKKLFRIHERTLGAYIFDGSSLYMANRISPDPLILASVRESDQQVVELRIRLVAQLAPTDVMYLQIYNIMIRKCLEHMELEEIGRNFYDRHQAIKIETHRLELWPGYKTSMRNHEYDVLLGVESTHKVLRMDNCLRVMEQLRDRANHRQAIKDELVGSIVMTHYNRKTYRVDDIEWDKNPGSTFDQQGRAVSFADYYSQRYQLTCSTMKQPLLVSRPTKKDFHRGQTGPALLIPEFCQMTGLTDEMRGNFQLMKALTGYLHVSPERRVDVITKFMSRLRQAPGVQDELDRWGLTFNQNLVRLNGRVIEREKINFSKDRTETASDKADWNSAFRSQEMTSTIPLENWVIIVPQRDAQAIDEVISSMQRVGQPIRFRIARPLEVLRINDIRIPTYLSAVDQAMANHNHNGKLQLLFIVLPRQVVDIYAAVKKRCAVDFGKPSQCFVAKNAHNSRGLMSIATKVVVQINAKLGGEPWFVTIPLKKLMIVGFDVYHCGKRKGQSVGAIVATTNSNQARYYSTVSFHNSKEELSDKLCADMTKCMYAFQKMNNNDLPERIIMYRDGVGEGQLSFVFETELRQIQDAMKQVYGNAGKSLPRFSFIVVTKKINTRIFAQLGNGRIENPDAGTIVDDVITLPERFDFYLISQFSRQGTVSPASYNVLYDTQGLDADKIQRLTYKLCHMYFNWSGTVTVPAPCQYAHKLAYLTGVALQGSSSSENLSHMLHFL